MSLSSEDRTAMKQLHLDKANLFVQKPIMMWFMMSPKRIYEKCNPWLTN